MASPSVRAGLSLPPGSRFVAPVGPPPSTPACGRGRPGAAPGRGLGGPSTLPLARSILTFTRIRIRRDAPPPADLGVHAGDHVPLMAVVRLRLRRRPALGVVPMALPRR